MRKNIITNMQNTENTEKKTMLLLLAIAVVFVLVDISLIFNDSVWCDEAFSLLQCRTSFTSFLNNVKSDAWPPFYAFISRFFSAIFGVSAPALKIVSIIPAFLTMILGATVVYKQFKSRFISIVFMFMTGCMPVSIHMNLELRGYSWAMFFVTSCGLLAWLIYNSHNKKNRIIYYILYTVSAICGAYTHYYALGAILIVSLLLFVFLIKQQTKSIIPCAIISAVCIVSYIPWLRIFYHATKSVSKGYWIEPKSLGDFLRFFLYPFTMEFDNLGDIIDSPFCYIMTILAFMLLIYMIISLFKKDIKKNERNQIIYAILCASIMILVIGAGYVISKLITPMFISRYLTPSMGLFWLFLSMGAKIFIGNNKKMLAFFAALILVMTAWGFTTQRTAELSTGTEEAKEIIRKKMRGSFTVILSDSDYLNWTEIEYYFPESTHYINCEDVKSITLEGNVSYLLYLACDEFPRDDFIKLGYKIVDHGEYDFDSCYYFHLYEVKKKNRPQLIVSPRISNQNVERLR
ncbi:MAG: hypothetical protein IKD64_10545 [Lachnospiraceae bacterium]|nr:hypothetical protein [Lachnospiraceae bacterium]